ncbi:MAG: hypothetical protein WKF79_11330 [Nocardioides sp.]
MSEWVSSAPPVTWWPRSARAKVDSSWRTYVATRCSGEALAQ